MKISIVPIHNDNLDIKVSDSVPKYTLVCGTSGTTLLCRLVASPGGRRATICSVASQTDLSKCSVILSSRTSLGRFPTHRCRVSRTIPPSPPPPPTVRLAAALSLPDSSHSHLGDGRERERRRHRRGGGVGGHHCCWINHSRRFHCAEKRFTFTYRGLPSFLARSPLR